MEINCPNFEYLTLPVFYRYHYYQKMDEVHVAQTFTSEIEWLTVIKKCPRRQLFSPVILPSLFDAIKLFGIISYAMSSDKIYWYQRVPFLALALVVTRVRSFNSASSISGPKSNSVIRHSLNIVYCISYSKYCKL